MAILWDQKILLAKLETVYGTDAAPTGAANAVLAIDGSLTPMEGNDVSRELDLPYMGADATIPAELHAKLSFKIEFAASGTAGTAPAWAPLLRACGVAQTITAGISVVFNPVSDAHESATIYFHLGDTLYSLRGARGTAKLTIGAQGIPYIEFTFTGLFTQPIQSARPTPVLTAFKKPQLSTSVNTPVFTLGATALVMRSFALDFGNAVETRFLIGSEGVLITGRNDAIETTVEAVPLATFNPYALAAGQSTLAVALQHGIVAGERLALAVPAAQIQRPQALANAQNITEWPLRMVPLPVAGNDQWTLTLT